MQSVAMLKQKYRGKKRKPKGKLSSLEGLEKAVNNGYSVFYFPTLNFSKF